MKDKLFFFASASPRLVRRTNDYLFSNGVEPGSLTQDQTLTQAFGKFTYTANRVHRQRQRPGDAAAVDRDAGRLSAGRARISPPARRRRTIRSRPRASQLNQTNASGDVNIFLGPSAFLSVRGGYFSDNYNDTGISHGDQLHLPDDVGRGGRIFRSRSSGPIDDVEHAAHADQRVRRHQTRVRQRRLQPHVQCRWALHQLKGGAGFQRSTNDVDYSYPGGYVYIYWNSHPHRCQRSTGDWHIRLLSGRRSRRPAARSAPTSFRCSSRTRGRRRRADAQPRSANREGERAFVSARHSGRTPSSSASRRSWRLVSASSYDVRGDGKLKVSASWGQYFDWTKYELSRGSFGGDIWHIYYRSLDTLDINSLNLNNMPGRDLWGSPHGIPRPSRDAVRRDRSEHQADVPDQHDCRRRVSAQSDHGAVGELRAQQPGADDRGFQRAGQRRQRLHHR